MIRYRSPPSLIPFDPKGYTEICYPAQVLPSKPLNSRIATRNRGQKGKATRIVRDGAYLNF